MKKLWLVGLAGLLGSCSQPAPVIKARIAGENVVFEAFQGGGWFSEPYLVPEVMDRVAVFSREGPVWVIERDFKCLPRGNSTFPLTYGRVPACYTALLPAKPLKPGTLYRIEGASAFEGNGVFRMTLSMDKIDTRTWEEAWDWPMENHPNTIYPVAEAPALPPDPENEITVDAVDNAGME